MKDNFSTLQIIVENKNNIKTGGDIVGKILVNTLSNKLKIDIFSLSDNKFSFKILGERVINIFKVFSNIKKLSKNNIVLFNYYFDIASLTLLIISYFRKNKNIVVFHTFFKKNVILIDIIYFVKRVILLNFALFFANRIIFLTNAQRKFFKKYTFFQKKFLKKSLVIKNGIEKKYILRKKRPLIKEIKLVYIGRLVSQKGLKSLIELTKEKEIFSDFIIIGSGNKKAEIKLKYERNVQFYTEVSNESIYKYYDVANVLILPSYSEVFPIVILEAMARGVVILVSDIPGMREIVVDGRNGYLFPPGDIKKIREILIYLKNNPTEIDRISKNNIQDVKLFTAEKQSQKYYEICKSVLKND